MNRPGLTSVLLDKVWRRYWSTGSWRIHWNSSEFYLLTRYVVYSILPSNSNSAYESVLVMQSCPALCDPMYYAHQAPPSVHGIFQARILEWVAIAFSRGIFPTQGSNPGLPHCRQMLLPSEPPGKSIAMINVVSILKSRDIALPTKVSLVKAIIFQ